jgi:hypothetical protein
MRPTTAIKDNGFDITALIRPGTVFNHPRDVVSHPTLTLAEKRAILASWLQMRLLLLRVLPFARLVA